MAKNKNPLDSIGIKESVLIVSALASGAAYLLKDRESTVAKLTKNILPLIVFTLGVLGFVSQMMMAPLSLRVAENEKDIAVLTKNLSTTEVATVELSTDYIKVNSKIDQIAEDVAEMRKFDSKEAINGLRSIILNFGTQLQSFKRDASKK